MRDFDNTLIINNIFDTPRVFAHSLHYHIIEEALEKEVIHYGQVMIFKRYADHIFSGRRMEKYLQDKGYQLSSLLNKCFPDLIQIKKNIQQRLAKEWEVNNPLDVGIANLEIKSDILTKQFYLQAQYYIEGKIKWEDIRIEF